MNADEPNGTTDAAARVGQALRDARERHGWSCVLAAAQARLEPSTVAALEAGELERLGAPVFVKGHLRLYAAALGLDAEPLLRMLQDELGAAAPPPATPRARRPQVMDGGRAAVRRSAPLIALCVVAVAGVSVWRLLEPPASPVPVGETPAGEASAAAASVGRDGGDDAEAASASARLDTLQVRHAAPLASALAAEPQPDAADDPTAGEPRLRVHFTDECWTEITDATGRQVFYGLGRAGETVELEGEPPLRVLFGNAAAAQLEYDGDRLSWPGAGDAGAVARFDVNFRDGRPVVAGR